MKIKKIIKKEKTEVVKTEKEQKETKNKLINFRVTPSEYEALHNKAKENGVKLSELILTSLLA